LGTSNGSVVTATIQGNNSSWVDIDRLTVGGVYHTDTTARGTLNIADGGHVSSKATVIGNRSLAAGTVTVSGLNSKLLMAHSLVVGDGGRGTLSVRAKGFVRAEQGINIGTTDATASGTVTVAESGSRLESGTNLTVGQTGRGELEVRGGAAVVVAEVARVWSNSEGASSVQVTGNGSSFSVGRGLVINAGARSASFNVADRATASSESVGLNRNMTGGTSGRAELNVADGGLYKVATDLTLYGQYGPAIVDARSAGRIEIGNVAQAASDGEIRIGAGGRLSGIGQVRGNVVVEPGGTILAGFSPGMLNIVGDATFLPGSVTTLEIGGSEPGMFDQFAATGNVMLGGELVVRVLNGFVPPDDSVLPLILGGSFADVPFSSVTFEGIEPAQIPATWTEQAYGRRRVA
jgi:T5SS/PEP-CTERM-associated repeat protein